MLPAFVRKIARSALDAFERIVEKSERVIEADLEISKEKVLTPSEAEALRQRIAENERQKEQFRSAVEGAKTLLPPED